MSGFCTLCSFKVSSFDGLTKCPNCGHSGPPCGDYNQVTISINTHELRILGIWSENWANEKENSDAGMTEIVYAILRRIKNQLPDNLQKTPLSMREEFLQIKEAGYNFETNHRACDNPDTGEHYNNEL